MTNIVLEIDRSDVDKALEKAELLCQTLQKAQVLAKEVASCTAGIELDIKVLSEH